MTARGEVVLLGDSITGNAGDNADLDWFAMASETADYPLVLAANEGVGGNKVADMLARVATDVVALAPDYCIVLGGTNDAAAATPVQDVIDDLTAIYNALDAADITIIAGTIPPRTGVSDPGEAEVISEVNAWLRTNLTATWPGSVLVDWNEAMSEPGDETDPVDAYFSDGVHPNAAGAAVMAGVLAPIIAAL